jgi:hypothetical protein
MTCKGPIGLPMLQTFSVPVACPLYSRSIFPFGRLCGIFHLRQAFSFSRDSLVCAPLSAHVRAGGGFGGGGVSSPVRRRSPPQKGACAVVRLKRFHRAARRADGVLRRSMGRGAAGWRRAWSRPLPTRSRPPPPVPQGWPSFAGGVSAAPVPPAAMLAGRLGAWAAGVAGWPGLPRRAGGADAPRPPSFAVAAPRGAGRTPPKI